MPQVIPGILLGQGVYIFRGAQDPNTISDFGPNSGAGGSIPPASVALASLYLRTDTGTLYVKTAAPNTWTAK